jgi:signal transduction histidine kinase
LDNLGLAAAIEWQAKDFTKRTRVPSDVTVPKETGKLDRDLSTALFRILQESLTNVGRHARASRVRIEFRQTQEEIIFEIADNGRGIRDAEANAASSLGLIGMRERLHPWKGSLDVVGREGQGTTVRVRVPLKDPS